MALQYYIVMTSNHTPSICGLYLDERMQTKGSKCYHIVKQIKPFCIHPSTCNIGVKQQ